MPGHVLFVCETYPPDFGGLAQAGQRISSALQPHCASLRRLCLDKGLEPATACWDEDRQMVRLGPLPDEDETLQLVEQYVAHLQPLDLVHAFYGGPLAAAAVAGALRVGKPSLVSLRGNDLDRGIYRGKSSALLQWMVQHASALSCVSREQVAKLRAWFGVDHSHYIPNSVDSDLFYPDTPLPGIAEGPLLVFAGEMRWKKGLQVVLEVAAQAQGRFQIALVGGVRGTDKRLVRDLIQIPYQHDRAWMRQLYARADLVWLPAFWEGMPNVLLEAMACARPVLAHRVGGVADLLDDRRGWLLDLTQADRNLEVILDILAHPQEKGTRARQYVMEHHQPQQETQRYLDLYRQLLASP
jgi:glycosyltransferase involved in cell wall biosynthesis